MYQHWQNIQKRALETYALSGPRQLAQYQQAAEGWSLALLEAGFVVPLFVVLDVGTLLLHPDSWNRFSKAPPEGVKKNDWQAFQQRYWAGLRLIKIVQQKYTPLKLPFHQSTKRADQVIPFLIITFLFFLKWLDRDKEQISKTKGDLDNLIHRYGALLQWRIEEKTISPKHKQRFWAKEQRVLSQIMDVGNFRNFDHLMKNTTALEGFLQTPSLSMAAWHWALASNWRKNRLAYGQKYDTYLDDQFVRKYLENYPNTYATNLLQKLNMVSINSSILPTRSKRYTSFEEITPFGYSINPTELIYMSDPATEDYFWSRWAEESLLKLDSNTPEENPTEFQINYVIPDLPEMELQTLADDEQIFSSYAKYLTFLLWHDFLHLYIDSGCNNENNFFFTLFLPRINQEKQLREQAFSILVDEEWINDDTPFMIKMLWAKGIASGNDSASSSVFDLFYRIPIDLLCQKETEEVVNKNNRTPIQYGQRSQAWTLFLPETAVLKACKNRSSILEHSLELQSSSNIDKLLKHKDRRFQHVILIGFGKVELYRVQYGRQISLLRLSKPQDTRKEQEQAIRQLLIDHYLNQILMPAMG